VTVSELQIQNYSIVIVDERERPGFLTTRGHVNGVSLVAQDALDQLEDRAIVVDYENSHSTFAIIELRSGKNWQAPLDYRLTGAFVAVERTKKRERALALSRFVPKSRSD
jgi:hypothetical protein